MKTLELTYRRWGLRRKVCTQIPGSWGELDGRQMMAVAEMHMAGQGEALMLSAMCGLKRSMVAHLDAGQRYALMEELEWVRRLDSPHDGFVMDRLPGTSLYAPGQKLRGCSLQRFMTADTYFQMFTIHPDNERWLNLFVAALYLHPGEYFTPEEGDSGRRAWKTSKVDMDRNLEEVASTSLAARFAAYINYVLIRNWLARAYPSLFPKSDGGNGHGTAAVKPTDWLAVFDAFVGDNVADMRRYQAMNATDAFRIMNRRIKQYNNR